MQDLAPVALPLLNDQSWLPRGSGYVDVRPGPGVTVFDPASQRMGAGGVRGAPVADVVFACVAAVKSVQRARDSAVGRVDQQMVMVRHQHERDDLETKQDDGLREVVEKEAPVDVVDEQTAVVTAMAGDVID